MTKIKEPDSEVLNVSISDHIEGQQFFLVDIPKKKKSHKKKKPKVSFTPLERASMQYEEMAKEMRRTLKVISEHSEKIKSFNKRFDAIEETLLMIYTGIKTNQFLYAQNQ